MTPQQFQTLAQQGYNRIPLMAEVLADLDTPLSTYMKLAGIPSSDCPVTHWCASVAMTLP
jgi:anthranilate synthase component 1